MTSKSCLLHSTSFTLSSSAGPDCFHILLEIHVPRCAVRGSLQALHDINAAWQSEMDTDWPASLHLSVSVSLHVIHLSLLKSMYWCKSAVDTWGHWRSRTKIVVGLQKLHRNWTRDGAAVAIVTGRSNLLSLRILIESLLSIQGGGWTTTDNGIGKKKEMDRQNYVSL